MPKMPLVYIVLVNYFASSDTVECVESIQKKISYNNYRIIVVDNSVSDKEYNNLLKLLPQEVSVVKSDLNGGFASGCNIGIRLAQKNNAKYVLLLNNDTLIKSENLIESLLSCFCMHDVGMVGGKIYYNYDRDRIWYSGGKISNIRLRASNQNSSDEIVETEFITGCLQLISMEAIEKIGLLDESYFMCYEDADYCERMHRAGYKTMYNGNAQIYHKISVSCPQSSASSVYYSNRARYIYLKRYYDKMIYNIDFWIELYIKRLVYRGERRRKIVSLIREIRNDEIKWKEE